MASRRNAYRAKAGTCGHTGGMCWRYGCRKPQKRKSHKVRADRSIASLWLGFDFEKLSRTEEADVKFREEIEFAEDQLCLLRLAPGKGNLNRRIVTDNHI